MFDGLICSMKNVEFKIIFMRNFVIMLFVMVSTVTLAATVKIVKDTGSLEIAVAEAVEGTTIIMEDGVYNDVKLIVRANGSSKEKIVIKAKNPGKVFFTGDVRVELRGDYNVLTGVYFKDGARDTKRWKSHGPGLVAVYADHCEVSECMFYDFDNANSAYITTSLDENGRVPQYCYIHHCAFIEKTTLDQVINFNNTPKKILDGEPGKPMYHRVSYCYFSNPPKKGNAGGGIRIGYWRKDYGRCLIDHNLFERQDSEPEIVTSKSMENVFYANTILNCQGTLNFRHGDHQVALNNIFLGTDNKHDYGAMYVWGSDHIIGNNYVSLSRTLKSRGNAGIYFNCGPKASEHALAFNIAMVSNTFENVNGAVFHFAPLYERRKEVYGEKLELPYNINFVNNFISSRKVGAKIWAEVNGNSSKQIWKDNVYYGYDNKVLSSNDGWTKGVVPIGIDKSTLKSILPYTSIEGINLDFVEILSKPLDLKPLKRTDVGPTWCEKFPGNYFDTGVFKRQTASK